MRGSVSDVCCGGEFREYLPDYQCCGGQYVLVPAGQICCADTTQHRVDIGRGNSCCGSVPYSLEGAQICCDGELYDAYGSQCCGQELVAESLICCGNVSLGSAHPYNASNVCCGMNYVPDAITTCCGEPGSEKVSHVFF